MPLTLDKKVNSIPTIAPAVDEVSQWHADILLSRLSTCQSAIQFSYGEQPPPSKVSSSPTTNHDKGKKHSFKSQSTGGLQAQVKKQKTHTCMRCQCSDCPAAWRGPCPNQPVGCQTQKHEVLKLIVELGPCQQFSRHKTSFAHSHSTYQTASNPTMTCEGLSWAKGERTA